MNTLNDTNQEINRSEEEQLNKLLSTWTAMLEAMKELIAHNQSSYEPFGVVNLITILKEELANPNESKPYPMMMGLMPMNIAFMDLDVFFEREVNRVLPNFEVARHLAAIEDKGERDLHVLQQVNKKLFLATEVIEPTPMSEGMSTKDYSIFELASIDELLSKIHKYSQGAYARYDPIGVLQYRNFLLKEINSKREPENNSSAERAQFLEMAKEDVGIFFEKMVSFRHPNYMLFFKVIEEKEYLRKHSEVLGLLINQLGQTVPNPQPVFYPQAQPGRGVMGMNLSSY